MNFPRSFAAPVEGKHLSCCQMLAFLSRRSRRTLPPPTTEPRGRTEYLYDLIGSNERATTQLPNGSILGQSITNGFGQTSVQAQPNTLGGFIYSRSEYNDKGELTRQYQDSGFGTGFLTTPHCCGKLANVYLIPSSLRFIGDSHPSYMSCLTPPFKKSRTYFLGFF